MKTQTQSKRKRGERKPDPRTVRIEFQAEKAQRVCIAGVFNDWRPEVTPMLNLGDGRWVKELALPPGRYEYRMVTDGEWKCDPAAVEHVLNPYGTCNSVLEVPPQIEKEQRT